MGFNFGNEYKNIRYCMGCGRLLRCFLFREYAKSARQFKTQFFTEGEPSMADVEAVYWRIVEQATPQVQVHYGNDVSSADWGSGFEFLHGNTPNLGEDDKRFKFSRPADSEETTRIYNGKPGCCVELIVLYRLPSMESEFATDSVNFGSFTVCCFGNSITCIV